MKSRTTLLFLALLTCMTAGASALFYFQYSSAANEQQMQNTANQSAQIIAGEMGVAIEFHQRTLLAFAQLPQVRKFAADTRSNSQDEIAHLLDILCGAIDGSLCYLMDMDGSVTSHNTTSAVPNLIGRNFSFRPYFSDAIAYQRSVYAAKGVATGKRGVYFGHRIENDQGGALGVAVIKVPPQFLASGFRGFGDKAVLLAPDGIVFAANDDSWVLKSLAPLSKRRRAELLESRQFGDSVIDASLNLVQQQGRLVNGEGAMYIQGRADIDQLYGWQAVYLIDEMQSDKRQTDSWIAYGFSALAMVMLGAVLLFYWTGRKDRLQRRTAENALRESESRLRRLTELSNEAIVIHQDGQIVDANGAAEKLFGYDRMELMQMEVWHLITSDTQSFAREQVLQDNELPYEVDGRRQDGETFPLEICAKTTFMGGEQVRVACLRDISRRKDQEAHIRYLALYDGLTQLPNRHNLLEQLDASIQQADQREQPLHLMFIDLDDFKKVNDSLGHGAGDRLLVAVASRMRLLIEDDEVLARYGGDEFLVLLNNKSNERAQTLAGKVLQALRQPFAVDGSTFYISGSVGIARYPDDADNASELLRQADTAMYSSKEEGRNTYNFFEQEMNKQVSERIAIEHHLRGALINRELYVEYQPVFFAQDGALVAAEALLRWRSPELGFVGPDKFIPVAEETGMIEQIGRWVIEQACWQAKHWLNRGLAPFYISVNLSPRQFRDPNLIGFLENLLKHTELPPHTLVFELTEGVLIKDDEATQRIMNELSRLGLGIAMDDFGTGYSSLSYLKRFPFNTLKIDREFVRDLENDPSDQKLIVATIAMAKALGLRVVAEGVENEAQQQFLRKAGCHYLQGFLLSRPISPDRFDGDFLAEGSEGEPLTDTEEMETAEGAIEKSIG